MTDESLEQPSPLKTVDSATSGGTSESALSDLLCERATKLTRGCVIFMNAESGVPGYGNVQCVQEVNEQLGVISLFGHNQHCKIRNIKKVIEYPLVEIIDT